jgi:hypothetical protein
MGAGMYVPAASKRDKPTLRQKRERARLCSKEQIELTLIY